MRLTSDRAELASAVTDLLLAAVALLGARRAPRGGWRAAFALGAAAALAGAAIHGLDWPDRDASPLWWGADFALAGSLACFAAVAARDRLGAARARRLWAPLLLLALAAAGLSRAIPSSFVPMLVFQGTVMAAAGLSWMGLARRGALPGARDLAAGCCVALLAGAAAASGARADLGWPLDANSLFHLVQIAALLLWIRGARASSAAPPA